MGTLTTTAAATWVNGTAWRDGEPAPAAAGTLHDRGFLLGDGLFETLLLKDSQPVLWRAHIDRLVATSRVLRFPLPAGFAASARAAAETLIGLVDDATKGRGALRLTVTRGGGTAFGLDAPDQPSPTFVVRLTPAHRTPRRPRERGTAHIVDQPRIDPAGILSGHKTTSSMWRVVAHEAARRQGADLALLQTLEGDIGEADTACFFAVFDGVVATPPLSRGILPATTRAFILEALAGAGKPFDERRIYPADVRAASEAFVSSSVSGIRSLRAVGEHRFADEAPLADWLDARYEELPGRF